MNHLKWLAKRFEGPKSSKSSAKSIRAFKKVSPPSSWKKKDTLVLALNQSKHWSCASYMHPEVVHPIFRGKITLVPLLRHSLFHQPSIVPKTQGQLPLHSVPAGETGDTGWSYGSSQESLTNGSCQSWSNRSAMKRWYDFESWWDVCFFEDSISVPLKKSMKRLDQKRKQSHAPITTAKPCHLPIIC